MESWAEKDRWKGCIMRGILRGWSSRRISGLLVAVLLCAMTPRCRAGAPTFKAEGQSRLPLSSEFVSLRRSASSVGTLSCESPKGGSRRRRKTACPSFQVYRHFAEIEVALTGSLMRRDLEGLPRAPGSRIQLLEGGNRARVQLAAPIVGDLIEQGFDVAVLRDFMLSEKPGAPGHSVEGKRVAMLGQCAGAFVEAGNEMDYPIPESGWGSSHVLIDGAVSNAVVTCVDVHFEIVHPAVGDLWVDLSDESLTHEYTLRFMEGGTDSHIAETVTGITDFAGEGVNQLWTLWATDQIPGNEGYIDYWWIKVYYEVPASAHPHDDRNRATVIEDGLVHGDTTVGATGQYESRCGLYDVLDVWHSYTPSQTGLVTVRVESDDFDTTLAVFDPCGVERACNDDGCEGTGSIVTMPMAAGREYLIRVAGYDYGTGGYALIVNPRAPVLPEEPNRPRPVDGSPVVVLPVVLSWNGDAPATNIVDIVPLTARPEGADLLRLTTIYRRDDRVEEYEVTEPRFRAVGEATAVLLYRRDLQDNGDGTYDLRTESFAHQYEWVDPIGSGNPLCDDEPFVDQPSVGRCTGVLVAPDLIATAGHCVACTPSFDMAVVFGYVMQDANSPVVTVSADDVYWVAGVVSYQMGYPDWGLIRLDREVTGRMPLSLRRMGQVAGEQRLLMVGHPWGVPRKYDAGATVQDNSEPTFFQANLDSARGSSGSPVVNVDSMVVEGLLTRGQQEFVADAALGCDRSWVCPDTGCIVNGLPYWQAVTRASTFSAAVPSFDVYLGTDPDHLEWVATDLAAPRFTPSSLRKDGVYYWRVVARNVYGQVEGPLWSFHMALIPGAGSSVRSPSVRPVRP